MRKPMLIAIVAAVALVIGIAITPTMKTEASTGSSSAPIPDRRGERHRRQRRPVATETVQEIAPGVKYDVWTFNGTAPGPVIRVHLGDTDPLHPHERQHDRDAALDRLPRGDDALGRPSGGRLRHADRQLPAGESGRYQDLRLGRDVPRRLHVPLRGAARAPAHRERDVRRDHRGARHPSCRARVRARSSEFYPSDKPVKGAYVGDLDKMLAVDPGVRGVQRGRRSVQDDATGGRAERAVPPLGAERRARLSRTPST